MKTTDGKWCHFPFFVFGKKYDQCIGRIPWCSTTRVYRGWRRFCKGSKNEMLETLMQTIKKDKESHAVKVIRFLCCLKGVQKRRAIMDYERC